MRREGWEVVREGGSAEGGVGGRWERGGEEGRRERGGEGRGGRW